MCACGILIQPWRFLTQAETFITVLSSFGGNNPLFSAWSCHYYTDSGHSLCRTHYWCNRLRFLGRAKAEVEGSRSIQKEWNLLVHSRLQLESLRSVYIGIYLVNA